MDQILSLHLNDEPPTGNLRFIRNHFAGRREPASAALAVATAPAAVTSRPPCELRCGAPLGGRERVVWGGEWWHLRRAPREIRTECGEDEAPNFSVFRRATRCFAADKSIIPGLAEIQTHTGTARRIPLESPRTITQTYKNTHRHTHTRTHTHKHKHAHTLKQQDAAKKLEKS